MKKRTKKKKKRKKRVYVYTTLVEIADDTLLRVTIAGVRSSGTSKISYRVIQVKKSGLLVDT